MKSKENEELNSSLKFLAKNSSIVFLGVLLSKILSYLYRIIIARNFGPEVYGLFTLALMILGLFSALFMFGLPQGLLRFIPFYRGKNEKDKIKFTFQSIFRILSISSILAGVLLFFTSELISIRIFHNPNLIPFIKFFSFLLPFSILASFFLITLQAFEKIRWYSFIFNVLQNVIKVLLLILLIFVGLKNTNSLIASYFAGIVVMFIASYLVVKSKIPEVWGKYFVKDIRKIKKKIWKYSWPLIFWDIIVVALYWIDSFVIGYFLGAESVGIYNTAVPIALLLGLAPSIFIKLFFPLVNKEFAKENKELIKQLSKQIGKWIFIINLPLLVSILLFPTEIVSLLFGAEFLASVSSLKILAIGCFFTALFSVSHSLISMSGKSKTILVDMLIIFIINLSLNIFLVPIWGLEGAAFATTTSNILLSLIFLFQADYFTSIVQLRRKLVNISLSIIPPTIFLIYFQKFTPQTYFSLIVQISFLLLSYVLLMMLFNSLDKNDFKILKEIGKKLIKVKPIKIKMNLKYKQDQIRYQKTRALCKGRVLHLGSSENDGDSALQNLIKKKFEAYSVDLENADYLQNLNEKEWKIPGTFDTVLALEIIEHIENPTQFIRNCCKLLKKGGRLILSTPNATGLIYLKNPGWMVNYKGNSYKEDWGHIHTFTPNMLKLLMENSGVKFKGKYYINAFIFNPLNYLMAKLFPRLRGDILIWGDKP